MLASPNTTKPIFKAEHLSTEIYPRGRPSIVAIPIDSDTSPTPRIPSSRATPLQKIIARWRLYKSDWFFTSLVVFLQLYFAGFQYYQYAKHPENRKAFGWGLALAKVSAGALYPTMFFLIISMSRWTVTLARGSPYLSGVINIDKFRTFHMRMAICAFVLSMLHTIGHLSGTFLQGSEAKFRSAVVEVLGEKYQDVTYAKYMYTLAGWSGTVAILIFILIVICSTPMARNWCFELFQFTHFLIYPMIGLLMVHGAGAMFAFPVLGFVMAIPTALVLFERLARLSRMFEGQVADIRQANEDVMELTFPKTRNSRWWTYKVGQYVLVRIPCISSFEWHPFTISKCHNGLFQLYVKKSGEWTKELSKLSGAQVVNVDGPYGAPCQQFYRYDHCIVIATGIGITPSSAILDDMYRDPEHPWSTHNDPAPTANDHRIGRTRHVPRFVDFYWSVPTTEMLPWFADTFSSTATSSHNQNIGIRLQVYVTRANNAASASTHHHQSPTQEKLEAMFSRDIDAHILTGRPDYAQLLFEHYEKMRFMQHIYRCTPRQGKKKRIGVFFCGAKAAREQLKHLCWENTLRGVMDGSGVEYHFHPEVF